jgi:hypothetical protein
MQDPEAWKKKESDRLKKYYSNEENKKKRLESCRKWQKANPDRMKNISRKYRMTHLEQERKRNRDKYRETKRLNRLNRNRSHVGRTRN